MRKNAFFSLNTVILLNTENQRWLIVNGWNETMVKVAMDIVEIW